MIGHPQGACGAAGVAASLLAMRDGFAPPTINRDVADPRLRSGRRTATRSPGEARAVLCNCIGFGSKNAALVLGQVPDLARPPVGG